MKFNQSLYHKSRLRRLIKKLSKAERSLLLLCLIGLMVGLIGLTVVYKQKNYNIEPDKGGTLLEGIVAVSSDQVDSEINNLVNFPLVRYSENGDIIPGLAEKYDISADAKTYTFTLKPNVPAKIVADAIKSSNNGLGDSQIEAKEGSIIIKLGSPYSPLLGDLTQPSIPLGPYRVVRKDNKEVVLTANKDFVFQEPYITQIKIKIYTDNQKLLGAIKRGDIFSAVNLPESIDGFNLYQLDLPRYQALFFNLDRDPWKSVDLRRKIARNELIENNQKLIVTTTESMIKNNSLELLKEKTSKTNLIIEEKVVDDKYLKEEIISKRDFDAILYGIDYGRDPDLYSFWHSSQAADGGKNLSGFKSKTVDKLIEESLLNPNLDIRKKNYQEAQKIIDDQAPLIIVSQTKVDYQIIKKVGGVKMGFAVNSGDRFNNVWQWYIRTKRKPKG